MVWTLRAQAQALCQISRSGTRACIRRTDQILIGIFLALSSQVLLSAEIDLSQVDLSSRFAAAVLGTSWEEVQDAPVPSTFIQKRYKRLTKIFHPDSRDWEQMKIVPGMEQALATIKGVPRDEALEELASEAFKIVATAYEILVLTLEAGFAVPPPMPENPLFPRAASPRTETRGNSYPESGSGNYPSHHRDVHTAFWKLARHRSKALDVERMPRLEKMGFKFHQASSFDPQTNTWTELYTGFQFQWDPELRRYINDSLGMYFFPGPPGGERDLIFDPRTQLLFMPCFSAWKLPSDPDFSPALRPIDLPIVEMKCSPPNSKEDRSIPYLVPEALGKPRALGKQSIHSEDRGLARRQGPVFATEADSKEEETAYLPGRSKDSAQPIDLRRYNLSKVVDMRADFLEVNANESESLRQAYLDSRKRGERELYLNRERFVVGLAKSGLGSSLPFASNDRSRIPAHRSQRVLEAAVAAADLLSSQERQSKLREVELYLRSYDEDLTDGGTTSEQAALRMVEQVFQLSLSAVKRHPRQSAISCSARILR